MKSQFRIRLMRCPELARFLDLYASAHRFLSAATDELIDCHAEHRDFDRAWEACEAARVRCNQIQTAIYKHFHEHRCALNPTGLRPVPQPSAAPHESVPQRKPARIPS